MAFDFGTRYVDAAATHILVLYALASARWGGQIGAFAPIPPQIGSGDYRKSVEKFFG